MVADAPSYVPEQDDAYLAVLEQLGALMGAAPSRLAQVNLRHQRGHDCSRVKAGLCLDCRCVLLSYPTMFKTNSNLLHTYAPCPRAMLLCCVLETPQRGLEQVCIALTSDGWLML